MRADGRVLERIGLAVADGAAILHASVVPDPEHGAVISDQRRADRDSALVAADPSLRDRVLQADPIPVRRVMPHR